MQLMYHHFGNSRSHQPPATAGNFWVSMTSRPARVRDEICRGQGREAFWCVKLLTFSCIRFQTLPCSNSSPFLRTSAQPAELNSKPCIPPPLRIALWRFSMCSTLNPGHGLSQGRHDINAHQHMPLRDLRLLPVFSMLIYSFLSSLDG